MMQELWIDASLRSLALGVLVLLPVAAARPKNPRVLDLVGKGLLVALFAVPVLAVAVPPLAVELPGTEAVQGIAQPLTPIAFPMSPKAPAVNSPLPSTNPPRANDPAAGSPSAGAAGLAPGVALGLLYFLGVVLLLARSVASWRALRRLLASARPLSPDDIRWPTTLAGRPVRPMESPAVSAPGVAGWRRPVLLLPTSWRDWDADRRRLVLTHEAVHVRRRDPQWRIAAQLGRTVFWFHPLAWVLHRQIPRWAELACDETTREHLGLSAGRYARGLLEAVRSLRTDLAPLPAVTVSAASYLERRIDALLHPRRDLLRRLSPAARVSLALFLGVAMTGAATVEVAPPAPTPPSPPQASAPRAPVPEVPAPEATAAPGPSPSRAVSPQPPRPGALPAPPLPPTPSARPTPSAPPAPDAVPAPDRPFAATPAPPPPAVPVTPRPDAGPAPPPAPPAVTPAPRPDPKPEAAPRSGEYLVLLFDDPNRFIQRRPIHLAPIIDAVENWLEGHRSETAGIAVVSYRDRLRLHTDFTRDPGTVEAALDAVIRRDGPVTTERTATGVSLARHLPATRDEDPLVSLRRLADALGDLSGDLPAGSTTRLLVFTAGYHEANRPYVSTLGARIHRQVDDATDAIRAAGIDFDVVHLLAPYVGATDRELNPYQLPSVSAPTSYLVRASEADYFYLRY